MEFDDAKDYCAEMGFNVNLPMPKNKEEDDIIFHLTSPFMTTEAESRATSETYFWLGIHHSNKWKFVDGTEAIIRNTHKPQSDGPVGAFVLGKRQSKTIWLDREKSIKLSVLC